jgi:hypothetical protein
LLYLLLLAGKTGKISLSRFAVKNKRARLCDKPSTYQFFPYVSASLFSNLHSTNFVGAWSV